METKSAKETHTKEAHPTALEPAVEKCVEKDLYNEMRPIRTT